MRNATPTANQVAGVRILPRMTGVATVLRRQLLAWLATLGIAAVVSTLPSIGASAQSTSASIDDLAGDLASEKSMAETFLPILNSSDSNSIELRKGILLYAEAKAAFDGLITQLEFELKQSAPPSRSEAFEAKLKEAVDKRIAFVSHVNDRIVPHPEGAQKGIVDAFIKGGGQLIKDLTESGISLWREYRSASEVNRNEIIQMLESLRWPEFIFTGAQHPVVR
jgi:hypothetical protein